MQNSTLLLILLLTCFSYNSQAQEGWTIAYNKNQFAAQDVPNSLIEKQQKLAARSYAQVNCVGLAPDGGWVISYANTAQKPVEAYLSWDGPQRDFMAVLQEIKAAGSTIQQITFSPLNAYQNQSWVVLYDNKEANWKNIAPSLINKIIELSRANKQIKSVGLSINGGWVLVAENNEVFWEMIPEKMITKIKVLQNSNKLIQQVVFNLDNGWVLLYDKNEATWDRIPATLIQELKNLQTQNATIHGINFYTIKGKL
ncbi:MAG: Unknown protein [uncultured Aureispira sp.]|uniref:Uncharacterized protein n=1 Tax=uncultured Aureispira sp. TaxID=1331704 RepID=A0A6S6UBH8_9BACT|nr:MAG: Unknown protein [uncultured Aureispira sp.]